MLQIVVTIVLTSQKLLLQAFERKLKGTLFLVCVSPRLSRKDENTSHYGPTFISI
jgi:hypothetical protein